MTLAIAPKSAQAVRFVRAIIPDAANRPRHDFYKTPACATRSLLNVEKFEGLIWEPACGDGAISQEFETAGYEVVSSDLIDRGYGTSGVDFLHNDPAFTVPNVVTNPPFSLVHEFVDRALNVVTPGGTVVMLARLAWLESKRRRVFFQTSPLARVWVFSYRINVARNGDDYHDDGFGGMIAFAWYVWKLGHVGPPTLGFLPDPREGR